MTPPRSNGWIVSVAAALVLVAAGLLVSPSASATAPDDCFVDKPLDVGLVLDRSGSMDGDRIDVAKQGAQDMVDRLVTDDQSGLVSYASSATLDKELSHNHSATSDAIAALTAGGSTATGDAINLSHQDFGDNARGVGQAKPVMVLLTDGHTNTGSDPVLQAEKVKDDGIHLYAIGVGGGINEPELREIASEPEERYFHHAETVDDVEGVFDDIADDLRRNDTEPPSVSIEVPQEGHMYVNGADQGAGTTLADGRATLIGEMVFEALADDNCYLERVDLTVPGTGFSYQENATQVVTDPFDADAVPPGEYTLDAEAEDWVGLTASDAAGLYIPDVGAESRVLGLWAGMPSPENPEYRTQGVHLVDPGEEVRRAAEIEQPGLVRAEGFLENGTVEFDGPQVNASGETRISELDLFDGLVVAETLVHRASASVDLAGPSAEVHEETRRIGSLEVAGEPVDVDDTTGPIEVELPGDGFVRLFERDVTFGPMSVTYTSNLVHVYAPDVQGGAEAIVGEVFLEPGEGGDSTPQDREMVEQDDARSGRDAGGQGGEPVAIATGLYDGMFTPSDVEDSYTFDAAHGEKIKVNLEPSKRARVVGGGATVIGQDASPQAPAVGADLPLMRMELYDPSGDLRATTILSSSPAAQSVELNADENGTWTVLMQRTNTFPDRSSIDDRYSYYSFDLTVTDHPLLPQSDALSGSDAPPHCDEPAAGIPEIHDGQWPGVLKHNDFSDTYRFHADIGDLVTATLKPGETTDGVAMDLYLYDQDCSYPPLDRSSLGGTYTLKGIPEATVELPSDYTGTYYLRVERVNGVGNHHVTLSVRDPMPGLPTNDAHTGEDASSNPDEATQAPPGAFQGTLHDGDDGDAYALPLSADDDAWVAFEMSALSRVDVTLQDPDGNAIHPDESMLKGTYVWSFVPAQTGEHILLVEPTGTGGGDYTVSWGQAPTSLLAPLPVHSSGLPGPSTSPWASS